MHISELKSRESSTGRCEVLTADGNADGFSMLVRDRDVHVRREIAALELRREILIPKEQYQYFRIRGQVRSCYH